ncbi:hypothetical protein Dxin01_04207 [Deinococcus xinjiangensis]|uniref:Uncharacterized protein n=1 Tax=Deinococcus xinjiangensis TaxID=457454 RepID=A0ABP9VGU5_9DEIO
MVIVTKLNKRDELPLEAQARPRAYRGADISLTVSTNPFSEFIGTIPPLPGGSVSFVRELRVHDEDSTSCSS